MAERDGESLALVFLDLDRFKNVNDSLGHRVGDELLIQVAWRLQSTLRDRVPAWMAPPTLRKNC